MHAIHGPSDVDVMVVGAGIAGLTTAVRLHRAGRRVCVVDSASRVGGAMQTFRKDGFLVEEGPNTVVASHPELGQLISDMNLDGAVLGAPGVGGRRFVVRNARLHPLPMTPGAFLSSRLLSGRAKVRALMEPFVPAKLAPALGHENAQEACESVASFVERRLGREFVDWLVEPFVSGIFAGDPATLGMAHAFPRMVAAEQQYGSLFRAKRASAKRSSSVRSEMLTLQDGLHTLPAAIAGELGSRVRLNVNVREIEPTPSGYRIDGVHSRSLVLAAGLSATARMTGLGVRADVLDGVAHPPLLVCAFGFRREDVGHPLDGFGMLVPALEQRTLLGALFSSTLFEGRAPAGHVLVTTFVGGARNPQVLDQSPEHVRRDILGDLADLLDCRAEPVFEHSVRWPAAIPQYDVHYQQVLDELDRLESAHDGLFFAGNYRSGVSVSDTVRQAFFTADRILA